MNGDSVVHTTVAAAAAGENAVCGAQAVLSIASQLNDAFIKSPFCQQLVDAQPLGLALLHVPPHMLSPLIPRRGPLENGIAFFPGTSRLLRGVPPSDQAGLLHFLDVGIPLGHQLAVALGNGSFDLEGSVHPAEMLREEILAVELVTLALHRTLRARGTAVVC